MTVRVTTMVKPQKAVFFEWKSGVRPLCQQKRKDSISAHQMARHTNTKQSCRFVRKHWLQTFGNLMAVQPRDCAAGCHLIQPWIWMVFQSGPSENIENRTEVTAGERKATEERHTGPRNRVPDWQLRQSNGQSMVIATFQMATRLRLKFIRLHWTGWHFVEPSQTVYFSETLLKHLDMVVLLWLLPVCMVKTVLRQKVLIPISRNISRVEADVRLMAKWENCTLWDSSVWPHDCVIMC